MAHAAKRVDGSSLHFVWRLRRQQGEQDGTRLIFRGGLQNAHRLCAGIGVGGLIGHGGHRLLHQFRHQVRRAALCAPRHGAGLVQ